MHPEHSIPKNILHTFLFCLLYGSIYIPHILTFTDNDHWKWTWIDKSCDFKFFLEPWDVSLIMIPTWTGKTGKLFPVRETEEILSRLEMSGNFTQITGKWKENTGNVREIYQSENRGTVTDVGFILLQILDVSLIIFVFIKLTRPTCGHCTE